MAAVSTAPAPVSPVSAAAPIPALVIARPRPGVCPEQEEEAEQGGPEEGGGQQGEGLVEGQEGCAPRGEDLSVLPLCVIIELKTGIWGSAEANFDRIAVKKYV